MKTPAFWLIAASALIVATAGFTPDAPRPASRASRADVDTLTSSYDVGGVKVVQRRSAANDVVAVNLYLLGGTRQVTPQTAGIEPLLLAASEHGTRGYSKAVLREMMSRVASTSPPGVLSRKTTSSPPSRSAAAMVSIMYSAETG